MVEAFDFLRGLGQAPNQAAQGATVGGLAQPQAPAAPPANPVEQQNLQQNWSEFLARPETRAALLQFAVNVMQPLPPGQTPSGQIFSSIAGGAQAAGRVGTQRRAEEQRQVENKREQEKVDVAREGVAVDREGLAVRREETQTQARTAELNRQSEKQLLQAKIEADFKISKNQQDSDLIDRLLRVEEASILAFDPTTSTDPEASRAAVIEEARATTLNRFQRLQAMRDLTPDQIPVEIMAQAILQNEDESITLLRLKGVPERKLQQAIEMARKQKAAVPIPSPVVPRPAPRTRPSAPQPEATPSQFRFPETGS